MDTLTADALDASLAALPTLITSIASFTVVHLVGATHDPCLLHRHVRQDRKEGKESLVASVSGWWDVLIGRVSLVMNEGVEDSELGRQENGTELADQNCGDLIERHVVDDAVTSNEVAEQTVIMVYRPGFSTNGESHRIPYSSIEPSPVLDEVPHQNLALVKSYRSTLKTLLGASSKRGRQWHTSGFTQF
ncbi:hypothetical protein IW261DRAFT_1591935 [Armillaria novae-zelandiae]|uniref:Uncharacterized protein n=1 Tax=Armillaria novae-zelandiae TaxID=153914 RepID=A0AA39PHW6_9AGAR|nr:hypothetical protein IW261DRAFT_1591935 [Armillaria novae-zelandiae]